MTKFDEDMEEADVAVPGESKSDRFRRIVNPRLRVAVKRLRMIRQMVEGGNANNYEFTDQQRHVIVTGLMAEVAEIDKLMRKRLSDDEDDVLSV